MPLKPVADPNGADKYLDPNDSIGHLSRIDFCAFFTELDKYIAAHGVSSGQWWLLRVLWEGDDITQRELSDKVRIGNA